MLNILFFARIREQLGVDRLTLDVPINVMTVRQLQDFLAADHGGNWAEVLLADNVIVAINQEVVDRDHSLADGDEVAFFPPVTGG